jgi:hypothetical protein
MEVTSLSIPERAWRERRVDRGVELALRKTNRYLNNLRAKRFTEIIKGLGQSSVDTGSPIGRGPKL